MDIIAGFLGFIVITALFIYWLARRTASVADLIATGQAGNTGTSISRQ